MSYNIKHYRNKSIFYNKYLYFCTFELETKKTTKPKQQTMNYTIFYKMFQVKERLSNRLVPSWIILNGDIAIGAFSILLAYLLRFNFRIPIEYELHLVPSILIVLGVKCIFFLF